MSDIRQLITNHLDIWTGAETKKKSGRGRAANSAGGVYGIKKLRELILELAVRGKLVPQDAEDEPASEFLKRISAEKAKLVAEGKIKNDKPAITISDEEIPFEIPSGWSWIRLNSLLKKIGAGSTPLGGKQVYLSQGIPFLRSQNVWDEGLRLDDVAFISTETHQKMLGTQVLAGDLLFNITGASIGRCAIVPDDFEMGNVSQHVTIVRSVSKEILQFLHLALISRHVQKTVMDVQVGVSREGLSIGKLGQFIIPIPPLAEQLRIVAKVDELMALCDRLEARQLDAADAHEQLVGHLLATLTESQDAADFDANWRRIAAHFDTLFVTESSIDALKQTQLQLAVMGKLVKQDPNDEPASELLKRIQAEKAQLITEGQIKAEKELAAIPFKEQPFTLPKSWAWVKLGNISSAIQYGYTDSADHQSRDVLFLRITDIQDDSVNWETVPGCGISLADANSCALENDDLVIARTGGTIGKSYLVKGLKQKAVFASYLIRIGNLASTSPEYKKVFLGSTLYWKQLIANSMGTGQPNVNGTALKNLVFTLPPLAEQHRIVAKVDELMALCEQLKSRITAAYRLQQKLADALVEQAVENP